MLGNVELVDFYKLGNSSHDLREPLIQDSGRNSFDGGDTEFRQGRGKRGRDRSYPPTRSFSGTRICVKLILASFAFGALLSIVFYWQEDYFFRTHRLPMDEIEMKPENIVTYEEIMQDNFEFDIRGNDVMVFLHIQKTGGTTFGKHLVEDLDLERDCECHKGRKGRRKKKMRCDCFRPGKGEENWLFSRYSTGWKCGLHPDWTELTGCVDKYLQGLESKVDQRRYFYITYLRDPVARYLSEFKHVQRGATWKTATHMCSGRSWADLITKCYKDEDWMDVTLEEFMACPFNLAVNRQTRMLANLELAGCYNVSSMPINHRNEILLASAKSNLEKLAYFGTTDDQFASQYMFEETFNLRFRRIFDQYNETHSTEAKEGLSADTIDKIRGINHLDRELYEFAKRLQADRFKQMKAADPFLKEHLGRLNGDQRVQFDWDPEDEY